MSGCMCVLCGHPPKVVMHQVAPPKRPSTTPTTATGARRTSQLQQQINPCIAVPNLMAAAAPLNASHPPRAGDDDQCSTPPVIEISHDYRPQLCPLPIGYYCSGQLPMTPSTTQTTATGARRASHVLKPVPKNLALTPAEPRRASGKKRLWSIFTGCLAPSPSS